MYKLVENSPGLYVPEPKARPSEAPDFSSIQLDEAGEVERVNGGAKVGHSAA